MRLKTLILLICIASGLGIEAQNKLSAQDLKNLDFQLSQSSKYDKAKYKAIDALKAVLKPGKSSNAKRIEAMIELGNEYETFISDSALTYYNYAINMAKSTGDSTNVIKARLGKVKVLGILGYFMEGLAELKDLEKRPIPAELKAQWLDSGRQLYSYMASYTQDNDYYSSKYATMLNFYRDEQLKILDKESPIYRQFLAEHYSSLGNIDMAEVILSQLINTIPDNTNTFARAANNMAQIKFKQGQDDVAAYYLSLSAISDVKCAVKENMSLQELALYLYKKGDIDHAYSYISASLSDAVFCNARLRTTAVSRIMPVIDGAYKKQLEHQRKLLLFTTVVVSLLAICLIIAIIYVMKQVKKLNLARTRLKESNHIKEEYIGRFLDLCSIYMDRLDNLCKLVVRKVTAGQSEDLVRMTKSPRFAEDQHKQFYENFDAAFLHIYPTFIDEFNNLLVPEERITVKETNRLTTELRIFAFLRMGVEDSNKIASFLHYSVNTIYTYRNKMKNKALDRDHFEENVMKIGSEA
jgi:hypothetical protein